MRGIFLHLLNIFAAAAPKQEQKIKKNFISILAIVNYRNRLDASSLQSDFFSA